jgi:excinuclease ABC subunit C
MTLETKLKALPAEPGVYIFTGARGEVLYVGKAASLRERVRSYFQTTDNPKIQLLMREVVDVEYIVTGSERDALLLEATLIKQHQPRYNVRLKDDKRYPYIKITDEPFPRVEIARRALGDGKYFGPYPHGESVRETVKILQKIFRLRTCALQIESPPVRQRPCLDYYIGLCHAPCVGAISQEEYRKHVEEAVLFLRGRRSDLLAQLRARMEEAAARLEFERAARLRDQIRAVEQIAAGQHIQPSRPPQRDLINYALGDGTACVQVFFMRGRQILGQEGFFLEVPPGASASEIVTAFMKQYYEKAEQIPREIIVPCALEEEESLEQWLSERRGGPVRIKTILRGPTRRLLELVAHNAELALRQRAVPPVEHEPPLRELQQLLGLADLPRRIEAYDISNLFGQHAVGSMVVFVDGVAKKSEYRRFRVESVAGIDDFAMIAEVVRRRLERALKGDERFLPLPDLILIDGGKGQLSSARAVLRDLGLDRIPTVALAKQHEHIFVEDRAEPIVLARSSPALQLLQRVRDEAHRFAISYHRVVRRRKFLESVLDRISGIGPARKRRLLERFGSVEGIRRASLEQLCEVLPEALARRLYEALRVPSEVYSPSLFERTDGSPSEDPSP